MNLSKTILPVVSFLSIISLSTCSVAGTVDLMKKQLLQQMKTLQLAPIQKGKTLQKTASGSNEITVADSIETYIWENTSWEKDGCTRYFYDSIGRVKEEITGGVNDGSDLLKYTFEYDSDGKTIKHTSIWNWGSGGEFFSSETTYSIFKYYPGYTNAIIQSTMSEYMALIDLENYIQYSGLDSVVTISCDGAMDTTYKSSTTYVKISDKLVRTNITFTSMTDGSESMSYHADYITSGNEISDTMKCIFHFDTLMDSLYAELLSEMQYMMIVSKKNQEHVVEQTIFTATDSTFANCTGDSKMSFYTNSNGTVDSVVTQEWDTLQEVWMYTDKMVFSVKKITVGVEKSSYTYRTVQQITSKWKNGTLYLTIPNDVKVSAMEQIDLQGKVISRTADMNVKNSIALNPNSKNSSTVSLVRLKTDRGDFTCRVSCVK